MRRPIRFVVGLLVLPLAGSEVAWALVTQAMADGSHQVALQSSARGLNIVLEHGSERGADFAGSDRTGVGDPSPTNPTHDHGVLDHPDHIVQLPTSGGFASTATNRLQRPSSHAASAPVANITDTGTPCLRGVVCAPRSGPPPAPPSRSSILRI